MLINGQAVALYLGFDRHLYINNKPGKYLCVFEGRIFLKAVDGKDALAITKIPKTFDGKPIIPPPGFVVQGLE
jgi:hypothetical protein